MALKFLADENFNNNIVRALLRHNPNMDIVRVQDIGLSATDDRHILAWSSQNQRILLTHDVTTITKYANERLEQGLSLSGVFEIRRTAPIGPIIEDLILLAECSLENEWDSRVLYLPLR